LNLALFARLSERVEIGGPKTGSAFSAALRETRSERLGPSTGRIARLAALFGLDAFAGGFVAQSIVAYWFFVRWGLGPEQLALVFFAANALAGVSFFAASWVASRIGLLNTMVFTHLPSNVLLVMVPFMPSPALAVMLFLARTSISQMDVPTRQSYTMAVVEPQERTAAAGITNVSRSLTTALSPPLAGIALGAGAFSVPFVIGGVLKIAYDLLVYASFRAIRPPEEVARGRTAARPAEQPRGN
jgi:predicted MFS family arabinose efflux permease